MKRGKASLIFLICIIIYIPIGYVVNKFIDNYFLYYTSFFLSSMIVLFILIDLYINTKRRITY